MIKDNLSQIEFCRNDIKISVQQGHKLKCKLSWYNDDSNISYIKIAIWNIVQNLNE